VENAVDESAIRSVKALGQLVRRFQMIMPQEQQRANKLLIIRREFGWQKAMIQSGV
jgi:hypothetical protein